MDKIFSTRIDEGVISRISVLSRNLKLSKKAVVENAIRLYAEENEDKDNTSVLDQTFGVWKREDTAEGLTEKSRKTFRDSMMRHQK